MARPQQNWGLLTLLTRWASIWTMPNTASPKSEPPCGRAVYTPVRATILCHPPQKTAPGGGGGWGGVGGGGVGGGWGWGGGGGVLVGMTQVFNVITVKNLTEPSMQSNYREQPWGITQSIQHGFDSLDVLGHELTFLWNGYLMSPKCLFVLVGMAQVFNVITVKNLTEPSMQSNYREQPWGITQSIQHGFDSLDVLGHESNVFMKWLFDVTKMLIWCQSWTTNSSLFKFPCQSYYIHI